jgi:transcriptional regulator with XRE-family HTH domain
VTQDEAFVKAGKSIRKARESKGLSQEAAALKASVDQSTLSKAERLGPQELSWNKLRKVAEVLDCIIEVNFHPRG